MSSGRYLDGIAGCSGATGAAASCGEGVFELQAESTSAPAIATA
jgi:hypothetical protein